MASCIGEENLSANVEKLETTEISHEISGQQSSMAPIFRLPPELLAVIFSFFCTLDFWDCDPFFSSSLFQEPFIIATVCSHWRSIAVSMPSLWSTIMIGGTAREDTRLSKEDYEANNPEVEFDNSYTFPEDILEVALERSAQHPLKLWIECFNDGEYWPKIFTSKLRQICSRVEQMYLTGGSDPFHLPNLPIVVFERLSAVQICPHPASQSMDPLPWLSTAPAVRTLVLHILEESQPEFWTCLPLQSTQFLFAEVRTEFTEAMITCSKFSIAYAAVLCEFIHDADSQPLAWNLPRLQHLGVDMYCFDDRCDRQCGIGNILSSLTLPDLQSLHLANSLAKDSFPLCWSRAQFSDFLERSAIKDRLTCLSFHKIAELDDTELENIFQSLPFLTRLTVSMYDPRTTIPMLDKLTHGPLLPRLEFFNVHIPDTVEGVDALLHLVGSRTPPKGHLEEIVVCMNISTFTSDRVKKRLDDGLASFPGTRHCIRFSELYFFSWNMPTFNEWMEEVAKVKTRPLGGIEFESE